MNILCGISARGGSKGLPNKNIKKLSGKPLIAWTIEQALRIESISDTVVSTDSKSIVDIAIDYGAKVPFIRPKELAERGNLCEGHYFSRWVGDKNVPNYFGSIKTVTAGL